MAQAPKNLEKYQKHFSEDSFLDKLTGLAKKAGAKVIYLALILFYEITDPSVSIKDKSVIIGALGYLLLPLDLIPDFIPVAGYTDDFAALVAAYRTISGSVTPQVKKKATETIESWFGKLDVTSVEKQIDDAIDEQ